jgi:broad specificity phosphatase PhoE
MQLARMHYLSPIPDPRLVEAAMGTWEGLRRSGILERNPEDAALHQRWETDPTCGLLGGYFWTAPR